MRLMPDEQLLLRAHQGSLLLTTHRLRYQRQSRGQSAVVSMLLEELDSCSMIRITFPWLLVCAAACCVAGFAVGLQRGLGQSFIELLGGLLVGGVFVIAYLVLQDHKVEIASSSSRILLDMDGWPSKEVIGLFDQIEAAKSERLSGSVLSDPVAEPN